MESIAMSEQYGGEIKIVTLQQFLRIILVIILVPIIISVWFGGPVGSASGMTVNENSNITVSDLIYILILIAVGLGLGSQLRMPAGHLLGPMLVTALFSVGMNYSIFLPDILIVVAQVIIGTSLGARFFGMDKNILWTATRLSLISVISMLILAFLFVMALQYLSVITPMTLFISFAPGGVTEMSLIALSVASSPALVSAHHIFRIIITVSLLGVIYNRWIKELN
jgi:membrane AbrB-like protein